MPELEDDPLDPLLAAAFAPAPAAPPGGSTSAASASPASVDPARLAELFGARYVVEDEIGRGGVGIVMRGRDRTLGREVAIKVLRPEHRQNAALERRFEEEAQIGGQLEHPGIVPVHEMGRSFDERPYFVMRLIRGRTLQSLLQGRATPAADRPRCLAIFVQVCQTVAYAHARGVIHRDLKPANVMVGEFGEVQVADWGLAKILLRSEPPEAPGAPDGSGAAPPADAATSASRSVRTSTSSLLSQAGSVLGTLAYMPPEQARGEVAALDARADVFALGAMLCEILTGSPPYTGEVGEVLDAARQARLEPARARLAAAGAGRELVELTLRCLAPAPADRPRDAGEVAAAVADHLASVQERARAAELEAAAASARAAEEHRARRLTAALASTVILALLIGGGGWWWSTHAKRAREEVAAVPVREAMERSRELAAQARMIPADEPDRAVAKWSEALAAAERADAAVRAGTPPADLVREAGALLDQTRSSLALVVQVQTGRARDSAMIDRITAIITTWGVAAWADVDREFEEAFREWGLDLAALDDEEVLRRIRASSVPTELAEGLFAWLRTKNETRRIGAAGLIPEEARLLDLVQKADPDPWRVRIRGTIPDNFAGLGEIADDPAAADLEGRTQVFLGFLLAAAEDFPRALAVFRAGHRRHPEEFIFAYQLGEWLSLAPEPPWPEIIGYFSVSATIAQEHPGSWFGLGVARDATCDYAGAIAALERALRYVPGYERAAVALAGSRLRAGDPAAALAGVRRALAAAPESRASRWELVRALFWNEEIAAAQAELAALAASATRGPDFLNESGRFLAAGAAEPLGLAVERLYASFELTEAFESVAQIWDLRARIAAARHEWAEALGAARQADDFATTPERRARANELKHELESWSMLAERLPDLLSGAFEPAPGAETLRAARFAEQAGARLFATDLFAAALADDRLRAADRAAVVDAAACAIAAASGRASDGGGLSAARRSRLHTQARAWLDEELTDGRLREGTRGRRAGLEAWRTDPRLTEVRGPAGLAALPEAEAKAWRGFWERVQAAFLRAPAP